MRSQQESSDKEIRKRCYIKFRPYTDFTRRPYLTCRYFGEVKVHSWCKAQPSVGCEISVVRSTFILKELRAMYIWLFLYNRGTFVVCRGVQHNLS